MKLLLSEKNRVVRIITTEINTTNFENVNLLPKYSKSWLVCFKYKSNKKPIKRTNTEFPTILVSPIKGIEKSPLKILVTNKFAEFISGDLK